MTNDTRLLCTRLEANDPSLTELTLCLESTEDQDLLDTFEAVKKNITLKSLRIHSGVLSFRSMLALHLALCIHPNVQQLTFEHMTLAELSPIVFAILENDRLTSLSLLDCTVPSDILMMESLQLLLRNDVLESLHVQGYKVSNEHDIPSFHLSTGALANAMRLKKLRLCGTDDGRGMAMSFETVLAIAELLRSNQGIQVLDLKHITLTSRMVQSIAQAAVGHSSLQELSLWCEILDEGAAQVIGAMIGNTPGFQCLDLDNCDMGDIATCRVFEGITSDKCTLDTLVFCGNDMGDRAAITLASVLETNSSVRKLFLSNNNIGNAGVAALATALTKNETAEYMCLNNNNIGADGTTALADALCSNHSVKWIDLCGNQIGDDGATAMARMLTMNTSLWGLSVANFGENGLDTLITCLPQMQGLQSLTVGNVEGFTTDKANALVDALEQNTVLTRLDLFENDDDDEARPSPAFIEILPRVKYLLALNGAGRRVLLDAEPSIPSCLWPHVLARSSNDPDVLFHFLREKPDDLVQNATSTNKRKREEQDARRGYLNTLWASTLFGPRKRLRRN